MLRGVLQQGTTFQAVADGLGNDPHFMVDGTIPLPGDWDQTVDEFMVPVRQPGPITELRVQLEAYLRFDGAWRMYLRRYRPVMTGHIWTGDITLAAMQTLARNAQLPLKPEWVRSLAPEYKSRFFTFNRHLVLTRQDADALTVQLDMWEEQGRL